MSVRTLHINTEYRLKYFDLVLDETLPLDGITAIFGPSGSGKTTLLNLVAGFFKPQTGLIYYDDQTWCEPDKNIWVPPDKRDVGTLFQDARLFSHLSVMGNLKFADKRSQSGETDYSLSDVIQATDISDLLDQNPATLSGGEKQRVALARTLLSRPKLLLFDEPLSALDTDRKKDLLPFLETLPKAFNIPALYVSHDVNEVSRIADQVVILELGRIKAKGKTEITLAQFGYASGRNPFEKTNHINGKIMSHDRNYGLTLIDIEGGQISLPMQNVLQIGSDISLEISPRDIALARSAPKDTSLQNIMPAKVQAIQSDGEAAFAKVEMLIGTQILEARITRKSLESLKLQVSENIFALIKAAIFQP